MVILSATGSPVTVLEAIGTIGFAVSGAMAATRQRMDVFGVAVLGVIAAISGGTVRDLLLSEPVSWLRHWWPIPLAAVTAVATIPIALHLGPDLDSRRTVLTADALGLAVFSVLGCLVALNDGTPAGVAVIIGTISGITGGIIRDVLTSQPPAVFTGRVYALAAMAGTGLYALLIRTSINASLAWWISVTGVFALRTYALHRDWTIATIVPRKHPEARAAERGGWSPACVERGWKPSRDLSRAGYGSSDCERADTIRNSPTPSPKTRPSDRSAEAFIAAVPDETRREEAQKLCGLLADWTGKLR
jgi:uncharacterized membrane protein YeiH